MLSILQKVKNINYRDISLIGILVIASILLNKNTGDNFWRGDDPSILKCAIEHNFWQYFIIPETYQCLSGAHLTPWVIFSYAVDYNLFGLKPIFFYYHQIFSLSLVSVFSFILLRLYTNSYIAFLGTLLFLLGPSLWVASQVLSYRHYIEGLIFTIISTYLFILSLRKNNIKYVVIGCLFYMLATSAKEIYVPLFGILLFIPEGKLRERFYFFIPYFIWGVIYLFWRKYMLGLYIGGYQADHYPLEQITNNFISIFINLPSYMFIGENIGIILLLCVFISIISLINKRNVILLIASIILIILPILPVGILPGTSAQLAISSRIVVLIWWSFCILFIFSYANLHKKTHLFILLNIILCLIAWKTIDKRIEAKKILKPLAAEYDIQGRFFWEKNDQHTLMMTNLIENSSWYFKDLKRIKLHLYQQSSPFYYSLYHLPLLEKIPESVWKYNFSCQCMEKIPFEIMQHIFLDLKSKTTERALSVFFTNNSNVISWKLNSYQEGKYILLGEEHTNIYPIRGQILLNNRSWNFYICYESPEGWITYSPKFTLEKNQTIDWKRP
jgi:hypothetical protein